MRTTTHPPECIEAALYVAVELSAREWLLTMSSGPGAGRVRVHVVPGDAAALRRAVARAKSRLGLGTAVAVRSCYEAGRDGFWVHRALIEAGIANRVVDSASIEVNRRQRRAKTDRIDARKLVQMLVRVCVGEAGVWREVRVPSEAEEAARRAAEEAAARRRAEEEAARQRELEQQQPGTDIIGPLDLGIN